LFIETVLQWILRIADKLQGVGLKILQRCLTTDVRYIQGGSKSKLLIFSKYVNKTEK